jgi:hypothetical protein
MTAEFVTGDGCSYFAFGARAWHNITPKGCKGTRPYRVLSGGAIPPIIWDPESGSSPKVPS